MLWVALHCPTLPLDRIRRRLPDALAPPLAVIDATGGTGHRMGTGARHILLANTRAMAAGVAPYQPLATALALQPDLLLIERDSDDEAAALRETALAALRFTPSVTLKPGGLLLEIAPSLRLFGGAAALLAQLLAAVEALGLRVTTGMAATAHGAWLLAHAARQTRKGVLRVRPAHLAAALDRLPVTLLDNATAHLATLADIGCRTLGDVAKLPRGGLARRFGTAFLTELDRAYGRVPDPQISFAAPPRFDTRVELMARIDTVEGLLHPCERLIAQLAGWLAARRAAISALTLTLHHEAWRKSDAVPTTLTISLALASHDPTHLHGLLRERLARLELRAPVLELGLSATEIVAERDRNSELFPTPRQEADTLARLVEKLGARLGPHAVQRIRAVADHRPERAFARDDHAAPATSAAPASSTAAPSCAHGAPRPAWLLAAPQALALAGHRPVHGSPLALLAGPERIEAGWWDDAWIARDYYIASNDAGQLLWIYRQRQLDPLHPSAWYLHGLFG